MTSRLARRIHFFSVTLLAILYLTSLNACQKAVTKATETPIASGTPDSAEAYLARGDQFAGIKQYGRAIDDYNQALKLKPDYAEAYNNRGYSYYYGSKANLIGIPLVIFIFITVLIFRLLGQRRDLQAR